MKIAFYGIDTFSSAHCRVVRTVKDDKIEVFNNLDLKSFIGKTMKHFENSVHFTIKITAVEVVEN